MMIPGYIWSKPKESVLQNIRIASPCAVNWESMAGDERARHCGECNLNVYNLSAMTRGEAEELLLRREGRLCVRYYQRADGTILTQDCPRGLRAAAQRLTRIAAAALAALMTVVSVVAQTASKNGQQQTESDAKATGISIKVTDRQGGKISHAIIKLKKGTELKAIYRKTDANGVLKLTGLASGVYALSVQSGGYIAANRTITLQDGQIARVHINLEEPMTHTMGIMMPMPTP